MHCGTHKLVSALGAKKAEEYKVGDLSQKMPELHVKLRTRRGGGRKGTGALLISQFEKKLGETMWVSLCKQDIRGLL